MSKYVNAGIESVEEALSRLINGEVFYFNNYKLYSPEPNKFLQKHKSSGCDSFNIDCWEDYYRWEMLVEDFDIPEQGVVCWVSDTHIDPRKDSEAIVALVIDKTDYGYEAVCEWKYASPLTRKELREVLNNFNRKESK